LQPFKLQVLRLTDDPRHFALLPKMNDQQVRMVADRISSLGFRILSDETIEGRKGGETFHADPAGVCWANEDPTDIIAPIVPQILSSKKQRLSLVQLRGKYFAQRTSGRRSIVRFFLRMESSRWWKGLRAMDQCALAPDEQAVASFLLSQCKGRCGFLTDFPSSSFEVKRIGRKQFYISQIEASEAALCLRSSSAKGARNAYLPKDGVLKVRSFNQPGEKEWTELFSGLGDWCGFSVERAEQPDAP